MALEAVGGALLSASLQALFADIHSITDFVRPNKVDGELLNQLENKFWLANGVLDDAEKQQITNPNVRKWLEKLKDAIHNAEDLVDDIKTEALRCQLEDCQMGCLIPDTLGNLHELRTLDLSETPIEKISDILGNLPELRTLNLSTTRIEKIPDTLSNLHELRTLNLSTTRIEKIPDILGNLHGLRTLDFSGTPIEKIPDTLGNLYELRTLNLSETPIEKIPDTLGNLHELSTLSLSHCEKLTHLPTNITMLTNLCDLINSGTGLKEMPPKISSLKNLQRLPEFVVGKICGIEELGKLTNLHGDLRIRSLENVEEVGVGVVLKNKNHIRHLELEWNDDSTDVSLNKAREVLDRLQPHTNIQRLSVKNYGGRRFPDWMGHHSFSCLEYLFLYGCKYCGRLPPLGELPSLERLKIGGFDTADRIGDEFYLNDSSSSSSSRVTEPPFKSLKSLIFENMGDWKEWSLVGGAFPILQRLELKRCPKLKGVGFPDYLSSLNVIDNDHVGRISEEGCTFSNLKSLYIIECDKLFAHGNKWNLGMFTSLEFLHIRDVDMNGVDSFPEEEGQLPTTLTHLHLFSLRGLKSLNGTGLRHLTSLKELYIRDCQQLQCLPEEGLPASLSQLSIDACPLLKPRCQREIGQDWDKIHHIFEIIIDAELIKPL
ncbi:hypothetical protein FNV43_RR15296 [Rhamnella rubrinervis]|uniref:Rx N-terminal domain-containing protein n=1 Tax=Rhamnella rubrinervis TaxID=2594499 RepID=A0A8K0ECM4_9ROSA|nr:hypothetical protein FNV43_RR15296 [Rhamnella rubrinervis]